MYNAFQGLNQFTNRGVDAEGTSGSAITRQFASAPPPASGQVDNAQKSATSIYAAGDPANHAATVSRQGAQGAIGGEVLTPNHAIYQSGFGIAQGVLGHEQHSFPGLGNVDTVVIDPTEGMKTGGMGQAGTNLVNSNGQAQQAYAQYYMNGQGQNQTQAQVSQENGLSYMDYLGMFGTGIGVYNSLSRMLPDGAISSAIGDAWAGIGDAYQGFQGYLQGAIGQVNGQGMGIEYQALDGNGMPVEAGPQGWGEVNPGEADVGEGVMEAVGGEPGAEALIPNAAEMEIGEVAEGIPDIAGAVAELAPGLVEGAEAVLAAAPWLETVGEIALDVGMALV